MKPARRLTGTSVSLLGLSQETDGPSRLERRSFVRGTGEFSTLAAKTAKTANGVQHVVRNPA
jgi:hypothetical protein